MIIKITEHQDRMIKQIIGEGCGTASVCWSPKPTGVFQSEVASGVVDSSVKRIYETLGIMVDREELKVEYCQSCGEPIEIIIFNGGKWCCDDCRKVLQGEIKAKPKSE